MGGVLGGGLKNVEKNFVAGWRLQKSPKQAFIRFRAKHIPAHCGCDVDDFDENYLCGDCIIVAEHFDTIECVGEDCNGTGWYERGEEHNDNTIETLKKWMVEDGFLRCNGGKKSLERCANVICGSCVEECAEDGSILKSNDWLCPDCC